MPLLSSSFPHFLRNIPRIVLVLLIIASVGILISGGGETDREKVLGEKDDSTIDREAVFEEINRTQAVLQARPDYAAAWMRLSVLYEQIGESDLAVQTREKARSLNPNL